MAFVKIWVHAVDSARELICEHIRNNAKLKGFYVDEVNGWFDHLHCLMPLRADWSVAKQMQMIKGESANWVNKNRILQHKLEWADEYFAASVSENKLEAIRNYIRWQKEHHRKISFAEEYAQFLKAFGFSQG